MKWKSITLEFEEAELESNSADALLFKIQETIEDLKQIPNVTFGEKVTFLTHPNLTAEQPLVVIDFE